MTTPEIDAIRARIDFASGIPCPAAYRELTSDAIQLCDEVEKETERGDEAEYSASLFKKEITRLREALEFYADERNWKPSHTDLRAHAYNLIPMHRDRGKIARAALEPKPRVIPPEVRSIMSKEWRESFEDKS